MSENNAPPKTLRLRIIARAEPLLEADVPEVSIPGLDGELGIMPGHRPLVVALGEGEITYKLGGRQESLPVSGGYAEIQAASVLIFAQPAEEDVEPPVPVK